MNVMFLVFKQFIKALFPLFLSALRARPVMNQLQKWNRWSLASIWSNIKLQNADQAPEDIGIIVKGVEVLQGMKDVDRYCAFIIYDLNMSYPPETQVPFWIYSKGLDGARFTLSLSESPVIEKQTAGLIHAAVVIPIVVQDVLQCCCVMLEAVQGNSYPGGCSGQLCYPAGCSMQLCYAGDCSVCLNICFCLHVFSLAEPDVLCYILVLHYYCLH